MNLRAPCPALVLAAAAAAAATTALPTHPEEYDSGALDPAPSHAPHRAAWTGSSRASYASGWPAASQTPCATSGAHLSRAPVAGPELPEYAPEAPADVGGVVYSPQPVYSEPVVVSYGDDVVYSPAAEEDAVAYSPEAEGDEAVYSPEAEEDDIAYSPEATAEAAYSPEAIYSPKAIYSVEAVYSPELVYSAKAVYSPEATAVPVLDEDYTTLAASPLPKIIAYAPPPAHPRVGEDCARAARAVRGGPARASARWLAFNVAQGRPGARREILASGVHRR